MSTLIEQKQKDLYDVHLSNLQNPHQVSPEQINALPLSGGALSGSLIITKNGITAPAYDGKNILELRTTDLSIPSFCLHNKEKSFTMLGSTADAELSIAGTENPVTRWYKVCSERNVIDIISSNTTNRNNLFFIGTNPIDGTNDKTATWVNKGNGWAWYTSSLKTPLVNQPSTWMFIYNFVESEDCWQLGKIQSSNGLFYRSGNGQAEYFQRDWTEIYDTANIKKSTSDPGIGSALTDNHIYLVYE